MNFSKLGDWKEINKIFRRVYKENFVKRNLAPSVMVQLIYELKGTILKILDILSVEHEGDIKKIEKRVHTFENCRSVDEMFSFILEIYQEICSVGEKGRKTRNDNVVDEILAYIHVNYFDSQLSLAGLGDRFGFASAYLCKLFKDNTGENFSTYLEQIRIQKACELLSKGTSVNQVSKENEIKNIVFKKTVQMVTYFPYFISTVVMVGIVLQMLNLQGGFVNNLIKMFGGEPVNFMRIPKLWRSIYVWSGV